jgi:predicted metal-dependent phosphoesterase TrpH
MRLELHCHSTCSDGSATPEALATMALARKPTLFCLTDHDTAAGHDAVAATLEPHGTRVLRAMELSCREFDRTVHLLLYGISGGPQARGLHERLAAVQADRRVRIHAICGRLAQLGHTIDPEPILQRAGHGTPGRPHVAQALVAAGVCTSTREAFDRFLKDGGPADVPIERLGVAQGLALALEAGAKVSLAHPHTLGDPALVEELLLRHRADGLEGIEALYGPYSEPERVGWLRLAARYDAIPTGGSDYHGDLTPTIAAPVIELPEPIGERILRWLDVA